ncbi:MAG: 3-isopropylmalate dehydratase small subunit [Spirochaetales bacterium]|nr:3-isopropylmalate dehydratase small subunit [Spirochaetales bacterium]
MEIIKGKAWKVGDNIDTDVIIPSQYLLLPFEEMKKYTLSPLGRDLADKIQPGDIIIAGSNFGCGSSREQAVHVLTELKVGCIIAESFARIFFRNAINNGLPVLELPDCSNLFDEADTVEVDIDHEKIMNLSKGSSFDIIRYPDYIQQILYAGGLLNFLNQ